MEIPPWQQTFNHRQKGARSVRTIDVFIQKHKERNPHNFFFSLFHPNKDNVQGGKYAGIIISAKITFFGPPQKNGQVRSEFHPGMKALNITDLW